MRVFRGGFFDAYFEENSVRAADRTFFLLQTIRMKTLVFAAPSLNDSGSNMVSSMILTSCSARPFDLHLKAGSTCHIRPGYLAGESSSQVWSAPER
jgi:hypothetical protein